MSRLVLSLVRDVRDVIAVDLPDDAATEEGAADSKGAEVTEGDAAAADDAIRAAAAAGLRIASENVAFLVTLPIEPAPETTLAPTAPIEEEADVS